MPVTWEVLFHEEFEPEFDALPEVVQDELLAHGRLLQQFGPQLGRPVPIPQRLPSREHEGIAVRRGRRCLESGVRLRPEPEGDSPGLRRQVGRSEKRFYRQLIEKADSRLDAHLARVKKEKDKQKHKEGSNDNEEPGSEN